MIPASKKSEMATRRRRILKAIGYLFMSLLALLLLGGIYVWRVSIVSPPHVSHPALEAGQPVEDSVGHFRYQGSWMRPGENGMYEMYVEGNAYDRGLVNGKLSQALIQRQEVYFHEQIRKMVPSPFYLRFLKYFIGWFNRDLPSQVSEEYKQEIYGVSRSASHNFNYVGDAYQRMLNYHAAHDIGHALQNLMLVGCTSFATWGNRSADGGLLVGRNFDFWVGDDFAKEKIVSLVDPDSGYRFMYVTWGGFVGVVSGMNEKGLTVTINAAKSDIPGGSATPVSLVAREIVQYAANIREAIEIARSRKMFVSESFLVASAEDGKAVVIEKTPDSLAVYDPGRQEIRCANHFQSEGLRALPSNKVQVAESASAYRYERLSELMGRKAAHTVDDFASILRDTRGKGDDDIGLGNEKSVNQLIAHHSIIFQPEKRRVWVSTQPWQVGKYRAYDLADFFSGKDPRASDVRAVDSLEIPADPLLEDPSFRKFLTFREMKGRMTDGILVSGDSLVANNPASYQSYALAAGQAMKQEQWEKAVEWYQRGLTMEIATEPERKNMENGLKKAIKALNKSK
jgi:hypothetical protein